MATILLIHGGNVSSDTWNGIVGCNEFPSKMRLGGRVWDRVALILRQHGYRVYAPTLLDEYANDLSQHIIQAVEYIEENHLSNICLVGHSYAGMVISGVAAKISSKIRQLVYLDAAFPLSGESLFDLLNSAGIAPSSIIEGQPKAYTQVFDFDLQKLDAIDKSYIFCTQSEFKSVAVLVRDRIKRNPSHWRCYNLDASHLPQAEKPTLLANLLEKIIAS